MLIFSRKIITDSLFSGLLQARPVDVVWHQGGCCSPIFSAQNVENSGKLLFNKIRSPNTENFAGNFLGERLNAKTCERMFRNLGTLEVQEMTIMVTVQGST